MRERKANEKNGTFSKKMLKNTELRKKYNYIQTRLIFLNPILLAINHLILFYTAIFKDNIPSVIFL